MVVKIGVGVALLVVAHVVLVRKWKSATPEPPEKEATPDLSRRNTIVVPPAYQEIEHEIEDGTEEYSDEDGEVESEEERPEANASVKQRYQELRTTYTRSLTPESELEYQSKDDEEYEEEEEEEEVEDEEEEEEEEGEESDGGEYDKEEDDDDLLKRLEARYGKLGGKQEAEKEEEFDDRFSSWKRIKVGEDNEPEEEESESDKQSDAETYEYENITNKDDLRIKEQIDEAHKNIQDE